MAPGRDEDLIPSPLGVEESHIRGADGPLSEQLVDESCRGVAPVVLGHRDQAIVALGRRHHLQASLDGDGHGLLHQHVQSQVQGLTHDRVMEGGVEDHVHGVQVRHLPRHLLQARVDGGTRAQQLFGLAGRHLGVLGGDVAERGQLDVREGGLVELAQAVQVARAHAATTDEGQSDLVHGIS